MEHSCSEQHCSLQPKCGDNLKGPFTEEWISTMLYRHTMEYYTALKREEILTHVTKWVNLEDSELNNLIAKGQILYDPTRVKYGSQIHRDRKWNSGCQERRGGERNGVIAYQVWSFN